MDYAQQRGSAAMVNFVSRHQGQLKRMLAEAAAWAEASSAAAAERVSDWALIQRLATASCVCTVGGQCEWLRAA